MAATGTAATATVASPTSGARAGSRTSSTRTLEEEHVTETTIEDRTRELRGLLDRIEAHPERAWEEERRRVAVLQRLLAAESAAVPAD